MQIEAHNCQDEKPDSSGVLENRTESRVSFDYMLKGTIKFANIWQVCGLNLKYCFSSGEYVASEWNWRKVLFLIWNLLAFYYIIWSGYNHYRNSRLTNLDFWYTVSVYMLWGISYILSLYSIWKGEEQLVELLNAARLRQESLKLCNYKTKWHSFTARFSAVGWVACIGWIICITLIYSKTCIQDFKKNDPENIMFKLFEDALQFCSTVQDIGIKHVAFSVSFIAWTHVNACLVAANSPTQNNLEQILDDLDGLILMFELLNNVFGYMVFSSTLAMIPYYSSNLPLLFSGSIQMKLAYLSYAINFWLIGGFAAAAHSAMGTFPEVIKQRLKTGMKTNELSMQRLQIVLHQLQGGVGIRAKVFIVTWGWIGQVAGMVVTFGMILAQLQT